MALLLPSVESGFHGGNISHLALLFGRVSADFTAGLAV